MLPTLVAVALALLPAPQDPVAQEATAPAPVPLFERAVVIGASASAGYGVDDEVGAHTDIADALEQMLIFPHDPIVNAASSFLFLDPLGTGEERVERALEVEPTVVIAVDFLFWFTYGSIPEEERPVLLERGLALLDRLPCPVVIGDVPDMSGAIGKMLSRSSVPTSESLASLNARIRAWAAERDRVVVVPLVEFLGRMRMDERIELRGQVWEEGASRRLLQTDELHPTLEGLVGITILCVDALVRAHEDLGESSFEWDPALLTKRLYDSKEDERRARAERERKREERGKAREKEKQSGGS